MGAVAETKYLNRASSGWSLAYSSHNGTYAILASDSVLIFDASGGPFTATLPTAVGVAGQIYFLKAINNSVNLITLACTGGQTIEGTATRIVNSEIIFSDGANWKIFSFV